MNSFTHLIDSVRDRLYRVALRLVDDGDEAADVVQEVIISGWQQRDELVHLDNPPAWLLRMTRNRAIDRLRSRNTRRQYETAAAVPDYSTETPHRTTESEDTLGHIHRLMQRLPEAQRTALHLREIEGLSYREIATALNTTEGQVKTHLPRGRGRLRQLLLDHRIVEP